jgi:hypothetical protein
MLCVVLAAVAVLARPPMAGAAPGAYSDADYFRFADRIVSALEPTWDPGRGYYLSGTDGLDSRYNAALLTVLATAAARGHDGPSRNDERARRLAARLTESPPFYTGTTPSWADPMFHTPGWIGNMTGGYGVMDKAIDPKIAEGLHAAWLARGALGLPDAVSARIADEISRVAHAPFFRFPNVRLNQINWPAELYAYEATVTGTPDLLLSDYRRQVRRFVAGVRRPWGGSRRTSATNLSPTYRFHYQINDPAGSKRNVDSAEYANMTLHFLAFYDEALAAGMAPLPAGDMRILRGWVRRDLLGYWMHSGFMNWDTGLGYRRWMKGKTWAYALQGLLTIAGAPAFHDDPRYGAWAKYLFDRGLDFYARQPAGAGGIVDSTLFGVDGRRFILPDTRMFAARMAANAARAVAGGLGSMAGAKPPAFYAFDPDVGRLAVSTPRYGTAVVAVNRAAFPYGGTELARLYDSEGDPVGGLGAWPPAAFGVQIRDASGRVVLETGKGMHRTPARPPLAVRTPKGPIARDPRRRSEALAGTFRRLDAVGRRRAPGLVVTTRHRFEPDTITESWSVQRRERRRRYSVAMLFPSWGRQASVTAQLAGGAVVALAVAGVPVRSVAVERVRRFIVRGPLGGYSVTPIGHPRGVADTLAVAPQRSVRTPGPTLRITVRRQARFLRAGLQVRIRPAAAG